MVSLIIPNWANTLVPEDTMFGNNECSNECNSLGITESKSEGIKEGPLLGLKDNIIDGDVIWGTVVSPEWKCKGIRVENPDGNSKGFLFGTAEGETLGLIDNTMLGVTDSSKLGKYLALMNKNLKE